MKKTLSIILTLLVTFSFTNCHQKQYGYVQQGKVENFAHKKMLKYLLHKQKNLKSLLQRLQLLIY